MDWTIAGKYICAHVSRVRARVGARPCTTAAVGLPLPGQLQPTCHHAARWPSHPIPPRAEISTNPNLALPAPPPRRDQRHPGACSACGAGEALLLLLR